MSDMIFLLHLNGGKLGSGAKEAGVCLLSGITHLRTGSKLKKKPEQKYPQTLIEQSTVCLIVDGREMDQGGRV